MFSRTFLSVSSRISTKSNFTVQKITCHRSLHLACRSLRKDLLNHAKCNNELRSATCSATFIRYMSDSSSQAQNASSTIPSLRPDEVHNETSISIDNTNESQVENIMSQIPEPPTPISSQIAEVVETALKEPSFQELGIGGMWPNGWIQRFLEYIHITFDLPWWGCIVATTVCIRILLLPLVIINQKAAADMHNVQPEMQYLQQRIQDARMMGDQYETARYTQELWQFSKDKGLSFLRPFYLTMAQGPIFISFFWALRGMVGVPVESMKTGGLFWFTDLTVSDPYYLLPLITSLTLAAIIEVGADALKASSMGNMRYIFRAFPFIIFAVTINFEGAILCYWVSTNLFSLVSVSILKIPKVRSYFKIPPLIVHDNKKLAITSKPFVKGLQDNLVNWKVAREINSRQMYDEQVFESAGRGPIPKTYKYDPTKTRPTTAATNTFLAKKTS